MKEFLLAIDQGTTSTRAILFNAKGKLLGQVQKELQQHYPDDGWVEHDALDIWGDALSVCRQVLDEQSVSAEDVAAIGITNQRETTIVWDRITGEPIYRAVVWQDRRTASFCKLLKDEGFESIVQNKTGLLVDPYFSGSKLHWLLENVPGVRVRAEAGELAFGTVDSYLLWKLTKGKEHKTDATNASRTMLFNIHEQCWDEEILARLNIPMSMLPQVMDSSDCFGVADAEWFGDEIVVGGMAGDQHAALFGQACFKPGMIKSTYGTGCFMMLNTGSEAIASKNRLLTTVAYRLNGNVSYAIEGSIFVAGAAMQWLRDGLKLFDDAGQTESIAAQTKDVKSVYLVPAFTGLGAPYWDPDARGALLGLTRDTGIGEIVTAGLQAVCYQTADLMKAMDADGAASPAILKVDGGMVVNNWLLQNLADTLGFEVERPVVSETTALGAAYLAGLHVGLFKSLDEISLLWAKDRSFSPHLSEKERESRYKGWLNAVDRVKTQ